MVDATKNPVVDKAAERERLEKYWLGRKRYYKEEEGERLVLPEYFGTDWYTVEGVKRVICVSLDDKNEPVWAPCPDEPVPVNQFHAITAEESSHMKNPAAAPPPFDYRPPAYASDTHSGGPGNFDGFGGGDSNPRNPAAEGELPKMYADQVEEFKAKLMKEAAATIAEVLEQREESKADDANEGEKGIESLKKAMSKKKTSAKSK